MKKTVKTIALVLCLCFVLSLCAFASGEAETSGSFAQVDDTHWAGDSLTIESVEYADEFTDAGYVDSTLFTSVSKIIYDGGEIDVDNAAYTAILTVDGVQVDLYNAADATYTGDVEITLVEKGDSNSNTGAPFGDDKAQSSFGPFYYTTAAYISDGVYDTAKSVEAAQIEGEITDTEANGLVVDSQGDYFSAIYITNSDYTINDANINLVGRGGDDFNGWGAGIVVLGSSTVDINGSYIYGTGVLRSGLFTSGTSQVQVNDSVIITENEEGAIPYDTEDNYATPMMQQCPFGLGITGNIRATLACGSGCNTFTNSLVVSNGWAVLSTDSGTNGATALIANSMVAVVGTASDEETDDYDFTYEVDGTDWYVTVGRYGDLSGYIAYADSGVLDYAYGSAWYSPDYLGIITTGTITMSDNCYGWSGRIGFMMHSGSGTSGHGTLTVSDSSFDIQDIFAVIQTSGTYNDTITLDNVSVSLAGNGSSILLLQTDSNDNSGGPGATSDTIEDLTYDEYLAQDVVAPSGDPSVLSISNSVVQGDIYNAATNDSLGLDVILDNTEVNGEISSAWAYHVDADGNALDDTVIEMDYFTGTIDGSSGTWDYTMNLRMRAEAAPTMNNPVSLTLSNGSSWMVTGSNYLSSLTIDETSSISGMGVVMTVDGVETEIEPGTYTGEIVLTAGEAPARAAGDAEIQAPVIGEAAEIAAAEAAEVEAFEADYEYEPFNVDVGDGMVLEFSSVQFAEGDGTISIFIPDTSKQIDCDIVDGEWVFADADFVDQAIIDSAKAIYDEEFAGEAAAEETAVEEVADEGDIPAGFDESMNDGLDADDYPYFVEEYQDYVAELALADSFMSTQSGIPDDIYNAASPYIAPFVDINPVIGALDYPEWMEANHPGEAYPDA